MSGSGTGDAETTNWTKYESLLELANVLSPADSTDYGADLPLWFQSNGFGNFALPIGTGQTGRGSEGAASGTQSSPAIGSDVLADASSSAGSVTDSRVTIANGATVEIDGASAQSVTFAGATGTLKLADPQAFTGVISPTASTSPAWRTAPTSKRPFRATRPAAR